MFPTSRHVLAAAATAALIASAPLFTGAPAAQGPPAQSVRPFVVQDSMNIFRRFAPEHREKMLEYYTKVLALKSLTPYELGGGQQMILYSIGSGQLKLANGLTRGREFRPGPVDQATGLRVITFFFDNEAALVERFKQHGYAVPQFRDGKDGNRVAHVADPGGFVTELVVVKNPAPGALDRMEVGINASDLEKSRAFYREFVGLDELPPVQDVMLGVTKYPFRHGQTTINVFSYGKPLPRDTGSAGIQYVVNDVDTVDARAKARNVTVETPLANTFATLRTVWLNDPDGVTNYFAQILRGNRQNTTR